MVDAMADAATTDLSWAKEYKRYALFSSEA
jgi:hypothetical protein